MSVASVLERSGNVRDFDEIHMEVSQNYDLDLSELLPDEFINVGINNSINNLRFGQKQSKRLESVKIIDTLSFLLPDRKINLGLIEKTRLKSDLRKFIYGFNNSASPEKYDIFYLLSMYRLLPEFDKNEISESQLGLFYFQSIIDPSYSKIEDWAPVVFLGNKINQHFDKELLWSKYIRNLEYEVSNTSENSYKLLDIAFFMESARYLFPEKSREEIGLTPELWNSYINLAKLFKKDISHENIYEDKISYFYYLKSLKIIGSEKISIDGLNINLSKSKKVNNVLERSPLPEIGRFEA